MKISPLFIVLPLLFIIAWCFWYFGSSDSGAGAFAVFIAAVFVAAAIYNRLHNGSWFTDASGGK